MPDGLTIVEPATRPSAVTEHRDDPREEREHPGEPPPARSRWVGPVVAVVVTSVLLAPLVASALDQLGVDYRPGLDYAWIELRVWDVGGDQNPMVGPYSRIGANHPGPLLFYLLAGPYRLLGASSAALLSSAAILNASAVAGVAAVAYRRGRVALLLLTAALTSLVLFALGPAAFRDPWNPWMAVLPFLLFLLLVWSVALGDLPMLPAAAFVGSFLVQTHLGYAVLVAYLALWALSGLALSTGRAWAAADREDRRRLARRLSWWLLAGLVVSAAAWAAPLIDQSNGDPGNLTALFDSLEQNENPPVGYDLAGGFLGRELAAYGPWSGASGEADAAGRVRPAGLLPLAVPAAAFVVGVALAWRRHRRDVLVLQATVVVAVGSGFLATAMIDGTVHTYLIRWTWPIAVLLWLSVGWALWRSLDPPWSRRSAYAAAPLLVGALLALTAATVTDDQLESTPGESWSAQILGVESDVLATLGELDDPEPVFVFSGDGKLDSYAVAVGLQVQLEKQGFDIIDPTGDPSRYGERRTDPDRRSGTNLLVVSDDSIALLRQSPELDFVTSWNPRSPAQQAELTQLDRLAETTELSPAEARRQKHLSSLGTRIGVFIDRSPNAS